MKQELVIPEAALRDHLADLGKTGSGKTSSLKTIVEWLALQDPPARVCILDPIKSDWWGVTSSADGRRAGLPFQIMGGPHGHVPLRSDQGAIVGELVGKGQLPLSIVDMADFEPGGLSRFFNEFAPALLKHMRGVLYLVLEEAHEFAPKERAGIGNENLSVHWAKKLATAGRSKGIRLLVATQRTQALHNAVLGSCETLLAHRLTAPADQKPVQDWLKANAEKNTAREIGGALAQLKTGTAWVVSAGMNFAEKVTFPRIVTFDNSATPDSNEELARVKTAQVDRGALAELLRISAEQIDQTDPDRLRARIAELEGENAALVRLDGPAQTVEVTDPEAEQRAHINGYAMAIRDVAPMIETLASFGGEVVSALANFQDECDKIKQWVAITGKNQPQNITENIPYSIGGGGGDGRPSNPVATGGNGRAPQHPTITPSVIPAPAAKVSIGLTRSKQKVLDAVMWFRAIGIDPVDRDRACVAAGLSPTASTFGVYTAELGRAGLLTASNGGLSLTPAGVKVANAPRTATRHDLYSTAMGLLKGKQQEVFERVYAAYPASISRDRLCADMKLSPTASTMGVYISAVSRLGIIENAEPGHVRAAAWLFPKGVR